MNFGDVPPLQAMPQIALERADSGFTVTVVINPVQVSFLSFVSFSQSQLSRIHLSVSAKLSSAAGITLSCNKKDVRSGTCETKVVLAEYFRSVAY
jgi:hypothetical protein